MADSSNDPNYLRLLARMTRLKGDNAAAAANETKADKIEAAKSTANTAAAAAVAAATAHPSAAASAVAAQKVAALSNAQHLGSTFQKQIDTAFNKLTQILVNRDYKSKDEEKVKKSRMELAKAIALLQRWDKSTKLQQLGGHTWYQTHLDQEPQTLAAQVQSLKDMVGNILEDEKLKFGGRRRKRKTRRRRRKKTRTRRRRRKHARHPKKRQASKTRKGRLDFVTHKGDKAYNRSGHRQYRRHRPYRRRTRKRRRR